MSRFSLVREQSDKLWIETPFPVSHAVWDFFVFDIFPEFDTLPSIKTSGRVCPAQLPYKDKEETWHYKYLNRWERSAGFPKNDVAEIADGQFGFYWKHAYLPDDERKGLAKARWGLVHVPGSQQNYLDALLKELSRNGSLADTLASREFDEKSTIEYLFKKLSSNMSTNEDYPRLRDGLMRSLAHYFKGIVEGCVYERMGEIMCNRPSFHGPNNNLGHLVAIEFLKTLDAVCLEIEGARDGEKGLLGQIPRLQEAMVKKYNDYF